MARGALPAARAARRHRARPPSRCSGHRCRVPWGVAPTTLQRAFHPEGELAMARAAGRGRLAALVVSSNAGTRFAQIGETGVEWWLQAYLSADRTLCEPMLARAVAAGARAVVLTVDTPVVGTQDRAGTPSVWETIDPAVVRVELRRGLRRTGRVREGPGPGTARHRLAGGDHRSPRRGQGRPASRGRSAVRAGRRRGGVGLQPRGPTARPSQATAHCLAGVLEAVDGEAEVYVDGGLRAGLDMLAALALGADAGLPGSASAVGARRGGAGGARRCMPSCSARLLEAMRLAGCRTVADTRGLAARVRPNRL